MQINPGQLFPSRADHFAPLIFDGRHCFSQRDEPRALFFQPPLSAAMHFVFSVLIPFFLLERDALPFGYLLLPSHGLARFFSRTDDSTR